MLKELKRQRLQTLARALSERNDLLLRLGNTSQTDLKNVEVRDTEEIVPGVPASPAERWLALKANTAHESGHIIFTARRAIELVAHNPLLAHLLNIIEDARIERAMANAYPGTLLWLRFLNYYIYKNRQDWGEGLNGFLSGLCSYAVTGLVPASLPADIKALIDRCKPLVDQGREARDTWGALEQAREILALVRSVFPESPPPPPAIVGTHSPREAPDGPLDPRARRVTRRVREEPAGEPEEIKSDPDDDSGASGPKPETGSKADEPSDDLDENESSSGSLGEPDNPEDSSDRPDNPEDESGEVDEPELGSDQPGEQEEPGDGSEEPGEDEPDERNEADAPNERDNPGDDSGEGESDTPDDPNEWDESDAPDEADGSEDGSEEPYDDSGAGKPDEPGDEGQEAADVDNASGGNPGASGKPGGDPEPGEDGEDPKALDDEDFSALLEDAEKELSKMESDAERQEKEAARERVPEPDWKKLRADVSKDVHKNCSFSWSELLPNPSYYQKLRSDQQGLIQRLTEEIRRALEFRATAPRRNLKKGHLDASSLWKLQVPDPRVFVKRDVPGDIPALAIYLLVDCSGSMSEVAASPLESRRRGLREAKIALARRAAVALHEVCVSLKIAHRVAGFNSRHPRTTFYNAVKWDEQDGSRIASLSPGESNRDGYAIRVAARELAARPEPRKVLLVLSDGLPSDDGDHRYRLTPLAYADTARAVREVERDGIGVIGLFFGAYSDRETAQTIYDQMIYVQDASYLPLLLGRALKRVIAGGA